MGVVISVPSIERARAFFEPIRGELTAREGLMIDQENNPGEVSRYFSGIGFGRACYGNGITTVVGTGLQGYDGDDVLTGGPGSDELTGGRGADAFIWTTIGDTGITSATADYVLDFNFAAGDRLVVSGLDADVYAAGDQAFTFIGSAAFSGTPGEINYVQQNGRTIIQMQTGTSPDIEGLIIIEALVTPQASWFVL